MTAPLKLTTSMPQNVMIDAINQNFRQIEGESRRKVVTDEDGKDRIIIGKKEDGGYAIKVSDGGYDVNTATDDQLVMSSDWNMWKIVHSGSTQNIAYSATKRSSGITLNSSNIGYVSDVCIPIRNATVPVATIFSFSAKPQLFVRGLSTKRMLSFSNVFFNDGTNRVDIYYSFFFNDKYLVVRAILRWISGSVTITPSNENFENTSFYWEVANPTRSVPGGMGGGGTPAGQYVYYDSVTMNPYTNALAGLKPDYSTRETVAPNTYSTLYSYTYQFFDSNGGNHFPSTGYTLPVIPSVDVDD